MSSNKVTIGISCGDLNGIGIEILIKIIKHKDLLEICTPVLYCPIKALVYYKKNLDFNFRYVEIQKIENKIPGLLNIIPITNHDIDIKPGRVDKLHGKLALESIDMVIGDISKGAVDVLVTLPINKETVSKYSHGFQGHTEYITKKLNHSSKSLMFLCSEKLKIATITNHLQLSKVSKSITKKILEQKTEIIINSLINDFSVKKPKVAVLALNPHAGDSGLIGNEEVDVLIPFVDEYNNKLGVLAGPFSSDAFFGSKNYKNFDAIIGMYHDQSLIPFKLLSFGSGVNYTAGLKTVRVSPDHGVAYDIAGKNIADESSLQTAIKMGIEIFLNRQKIKI